MPEPLGTKTGREESCCDGPEQQNLREEGGESRPGEGRRERGPGHTLSASTGNPTNTLLS